MAFSCSTDKLPPCGFCDDLLDFVMLIVVFQVIHHCSVYYSPGSFRQK